MRNEYLKSLNKIEFAVTYACTGRCKHCSEGDHTLCGERIMPSVAKDAVKKISAEYDIRTVMAFGGEPLLYPDAVYAVMSAATECGIPKRQVITNGYFTKKENGISETARMLSECGVNDLLVSVDAFHQETIPLDAVKLFLAEAKKFKIPTRLQPAWLISSESDNPYNEKTREILAALSDMGILPNDGNIVFYEGNATKYLSEYFDGELPENPYIEDPCNVKCISFSPNGDVLGGNAYQTDIMDIIKNYTPQSING